NEAKQLPKRCPNWYLVMLLIARAESWEPDRYNKLFEEAVALEPLYHYYYQSKATYLLPRWHGEEGDWERFAEEVYEKAGDKEGSMLYSNIAYEMSYYYDYRKTFFDETKLSWPKVKQGYINQEALRGTDSMSLNEFCFLACLANDRPTAQALFARIGDNYDPYVWNKGKTFYYYKAWASDRL